MHGFCDKPSCACREPRIRRAAEKTYWTLWAWVFLIATVAFGIWLAVVKYRECVKAMTDLYCALAL